MIQLIVNTIMLRELDERKLINAYARLVYFDRSDVDNDIKIKENLIYILNWDKTGNLGLGLYCGKFENLKRKDWDMLINFIKEHGSEIENISKTFVKEKIEKDITNLKKDSLKKKLYKESRYKNKNYKVSGRGKKAIPCTYKGKVYKSRQECMYKENLTQNQLYRYLEKTGQV